MAEETFEEFYRAEYRELVRFVLSRGAGFDRAEDVVQEVMAQALRNWRALRNPRGWARKAAWRMLIRLETKERRQAELARKLGQADRVDTPATAPEAHRDDDARGRHSGSELVREILASLPPAQREVLAHSFDGFKPDEIADLVDKPAGTVRANLREARRRLRDRLGDCGLDA